MSNYLELWLFHSSQTNRNLSLLLSILPSMNKEHEDGLQKEAFMMTLLLSCKKNIINSTVQTLPHQGGSWFLLVTISYQVALLLFVCLLCFFSLQDMVSCSQGYPCTCDSPASIPEFWDYRQEPPCLALKLCFINSLVCEL